MRHLATLAALAVLFAATPALAVGPQGFEAAGQQAPSGAPPGNALDSLKNPAATVEAMNKSIRESDRQNQAAVDAVNQAQAQTAGAPAAPAQKPGGGKVIYGDIIIHK